MKIYLSICCLLTVATVSCFPEPAVTGVPGYTQLTAEQVKHLQNRGFGSTHQTFRPTESYKQEEEELYDDDNEDSETDSSQDRVVAYANQNYPVPVRATIQPNLNYPVPARTTVSKGYSTPNPGKRPQKQYLQRGEELQAINKLEDEKEEEEEPDRLSLLLPQSKFSCNGRNTGYYSDEGLGCEVFHYCQENSKHSWICPEGFTFHQVHLICMPPGGDNICDKSSDYHFVNDFLYKPLNLEEYQQKPNVTLRYSDRYYPEQYRTRYDEDDDTPVHHQHSVRVTGQPRTQYISPTTIRPQQVYRSPEEINISLQQRRPNPQYITDY